MQVAHEITKVVDFWFEEEHKDFWFESNLAFDNKLRCIFHKHVQQALKGDISLCIMDPVGRQALILLLDQFTRNIYRGTSNAYCGDKMALLVTLTAIEAGQLNTLKNLDHAQFVLMPLMHAENLEIQEFGLPYFKRYTSMQCYQYALRHRDVIYEFGRFPHRNLALDRVTTNSEAEFLKSVKPF